MRDLIHAPSPIGLEGAMKVVAISQILQFMPKTWKIHHLIGSAGFVVDTLPNAGPDVLRIMAVGHMDKIRLIVRAIKDGRIWLNSDSMLPITAIGQRVKIYSEDPAHPGSWRVITGGTIGSYGAVHLAPVTFRDGSAGPKKDDLFLELHLTGDNIMAQIEAMGIRAGDAIIFDSPVRRGVGPNTFVGAYLDNALGCHVVVETLRKLANDPTTPNVRFLGAFATHEEIGMMGGVLLAHMLEPHIMIGLDVNHDFEGTAHQASHNLPRIAMGKGTTVATGSVCSPTLVTMIQRIAQDQKIPMQIDPVGRITGTDAMGAWMGGIDAATTSLGMAIRDMHSALEGGHTGDVITTIHLLDALVRRLSFEDVQPGHFHSIHPNLSQAEPHGWVEPPKKKGAAKH